jgi:hypothetical protein
MTPAAALLQGMIAMQEESSATANVELMAPSLTVNYDNLNLVWPSHDEPSVIRCAQPAVCKSRHASPPTWTSVPGH